jgi:hypothetical protein
MRVTVHAGDPADGRSVPAVATDLNLHGALVITNGTFPVASHILLINRQNEVASARVVTEVARLSSMRQYGVEFLHGGIGEEFWGVQFSD